MSIALRSPSAASPGRRSLELPCPHCGRRINPYGASVAAEERCPACRRFLRVRVSLVDLAFWTLAGALAGVPAAQVWSHYAPHPSFAIGLCALLAATLAARLGARRFATDPRGDGTAVYLRARLVGKQGATARYALQDSAGELGSAELDLRTGRVRLGSFREPRRRARYAAYLAQLFADRRPGQGAPAERTLVA